MRSGLIGLGSDYGKAVSNAALAAQQANKQNIQSVDQYNLSNALNVAQTNTQRLSEAAKYNKAMEDAVKMQRYNDRMQYLAGAAEGLGDIGSAQVWKNMTPQIFGGYDWQGKKVQTKGDETIQAKGGKLKLMPLKKKITKK